MGGRSLRARRDGGAWVGVSDHGGWAVFMTMQPGGVVVDRRRVVLVGEGLPAIPHHHEGQKMPLPEAVALVCRVRDSAEDQARARLAELAEEIDVPVSGLALRVCPPLPPTIEERITNYRAMCIADWIMYREALAAAAEARGWGVRWFEAKTVLAEAAQVLGEAELARAMTLARKRLGTPWQLDQRMAMAAGIAALGA